MVVISESSMLNVVRNVGQTYECVNGRSVWAVHALWRHDEHDAPDHFAAAYGSPIPRVRRAVAIVSEREERVGGHAVRPELIARAVRLRQRRLPRIDHRVFV